MGGLRKLGAVAASLLGALALPHTVMAKEPLSSLTAKTALQVHPARVLAEQQYWMWHSEVSGRIGPATSTAQPGTVSVAGAVCGSGMRSECRNPPPTKAN
jgi:hypothetical protein